MKHFFLLFALLTCSCLSAQKKDIYQINVKTLIVHAKPSPDSRTIGELTKGDVIAILSEANNWYLIEFGKKTGYILGPSLDQGEFWTKGTSSVNEPGRAICKDFENLYDPKLNNYFQINAGKDRDLVIKLMQKNSRGDRCIRSVYVEANSETMIRNIPEGNYYVKVAYGNNWKLIMTNNICYGKFTDNAIYELGEDIFDFHVTKTATGYQVPSYQLTLEIITENADGTTLENQISEEEFNN